MVLDNSVNDNPIHHTMIKTIIKCIAGMNNFSLLTNSINSITHNMMYSI